MIERLVLVAWATAAAGFDARQRRLPNWLTLGGLLGGALYVLVNGTSVSGGDPFNALLAAAIGFVALFPAYLAGWMGAGDVKLFAAMGMLAGGSVLLPTLLAGCIITGIGALALIMRNKGLVPAKRPLPFGVGLALGFSLSVLDVLPILAWKG
jgi:prepilin peptidase CpaA